MRILMFVVATGAMATAMPAAAQEGQVIHLGDASRTCAQLLESAAEQAQLLGGAPGAFGSEQAIGAATSIAMQGALMSGAGRAIPGMGLLGNAMGAAARQNRERREAERLVAQQRWYYLNGMYTGRNCDQQPAQPAAASPAEGPATPTG